jgi:hypothetical protein
VKRTNIFVALACALLVFSLGCGSSNKLQSITLSAQFVNGVAPSSQTGFVTLDGNGGTIQLLATGTYSSTKTKDLTNAVIYTVKVDPLANVDQFGNPLIPPCAAPACPAPSTPPYTNGTVEYSPTGLITAVQPAVCTWVNVAQSGTSPSWAYVGDYVVTATYQGVTSQPFYIPVASSTGITSTSNPSGACGPSSSS